jgi:hypothetical protein
MAGYIGSKAVNLSTTGADINGDANIDGNLSFRDNDKVIFGAGSDLQIYHDGANSYITEGGVGDLRLGAANIRIGDNTSGASYIYATQNAEVTLYHNNSPKLATTSTGVDITGVLSSDGLTVQATGANYPLIEHSSGNRIQLQPSYNYYNSFQHTFKNLDGSANTLTVGQTGDISFYEDTGTTPKFFWDASTERLGIGTASPNTTLDITTASNTNGFLLNVIGTAPNYMFDVRDDGASKFRIDSSGNVGIGLTPSSWWSNMAAVETQASSGGVFASASVNGHFLTNAYYDGSNWKYKNNGFAEYYSQTGGTHQFLTASSGSAGGNISWSEAMRIDSSGRVGINNSNPNTKLDIIGSSTNGSGVVDTLRLRNTGTTLNDGPRLQFTSGSSTSGAAIASQGKALNSADLLFYAGGNTESMRLDASGNLLVGKTATNFNTAGIEARSGGTLWATADGTNAASFNRKTSDGAIAYFNKDGSTVGSIGAYSGDLYVVNAGGVGAGLRYNSGFPNILPCNGTGADRDNAIDLGHSSVRFDDVYATNGTIQTSDRNEKQDIAELSDAEQRVAVAAKGLLRKFRWSDAVAEKGDEARTHFGIIAQDLQAAFAAEGLDAGDYAMFISSTWTDEETGEERTRMGVRYSELLAFIIGAL